MVNTVYTTTLVYKYGIATKAEGLGLMRGLSFDQELTGVDTAHVYLYTIDPVLGRPWKKGLCKKQKHGINKPLSFR